MAFLIRAEGLNYRYFIEDTQDLAVIRGGGLALLELGEIAQAIPGLAVVASGASQVIFRYDSEDPPDLVTIRDAIVRKNVCLSHATILIDMIPESGNFVEDRARLISMNRWRQMQVPSLVYPDLADGEVAGQRICEADQVRPAAHSFRHWDSETGEMTTETLSAATHARHEYGRNNKQAFFQNEFVHRLNDETLNEVKFSNTLHEIAGESGHKPPLRNKLAVLYLDGNGFGSRFLSQCETPCKQETASRNLRRLHATFLRDLVASVRGKSTWLFRRRLEGGGTEDVLRLEVLLWGADEIVLVVPGWQGLATLDLFFRKSANWRPFPDDQPVTYKAGIVLCNSKSDIHRAGKLARELGNFAKLDGKNSFAYQVLESFDHLGKRAAVHFETGYYFSREKTSFVLNGDGIREFSRAAVQLKRLVARRQLHSYGRWLVSGRGLDSPPSIVGCGTEWGRFTASLFPSAAQGTTEQAAWLHFTQLWDYFAEEKEFLP